MVAPFETARPTRQARTRQSPSLFIIIAPLLLMIEIWINLPLNSTRTTGWEAPRQVIPLVNLFALLNMDYHAFLSGMSKTTEVAMQVVSQADTPRKGQRDSFNANGQSPSSLMKTASRRRKNVNDSRPASLSQANLGFPCRNPYNGDSDSDALDDLPTPGSRFHVPLELDIHLQNSTAVEGSSLDGIIVFKVSKTRKKDSPIRIGSAKLRVIGFEANSNDRHTFYRHSARLEYAAPSFRTLFRPSSDLDEYRVAPAGTYTVPFSLMLPRASGAKGSVIGRASVSVRYIILMFVLSLLETAIP
jgi:hypothetical protein